jgi:glucose-6-phosphate isomerase
MPDRLILQYDNMLSSRIGDHGIDPAALDELADRFTTLHEAVEQRRLSGDLAFYTLPGDTATVREIRDFAEGVGQAFDTVVVLGIGGSALGTAALQQALLKPFWNELDDEARDYFPRLFVLDNVDPSTLVPLFERIDFARTLFNVISKSGATAETMAQFLIIREKLREVFGDDEGYRRHFIFTTDPEKGVLRKLAIEENIATLPVPAKVGGRFSVLSAVGLLPAALVGIDIDALLAGAAAMAERCARPRLRDNPAAVFAALQYLADTERAARIHVMMPYTDRLAGIADWFRQLWAESLGKRTDLAGKEVFRGPTPVKALGATDQHSQVQLYIEGPFDKTITFLAARTLPLDLAIPSAYTDVDELGYLGGRTLGELLDAERVATTAALASQGRMNMTVEIPAITAHALGQIIMMLQIATVYAGGFYEINPLDQPGVELGKQLTYGLMGRRGFAQPEPQAGDAPDPRNTVR